MKARIPVLIKDPSVARFKDLPLTETFVAEEDFFLDGPVSRRVAILDFDPDAGTLLPGVHFEPPTPKSAGRYPLAAPDDPNRAEFMRVTVFGGVLKTVHMFEESDTLGRPVRWAFDGPQLLVVPRAGEWANAFYERDSRSLQFFFFRHPERQETVYTCQSQDIIAHETTHAILDGVAPDLYDSTTPQSLALHEAIADLSTLLTAFRSRKLADRVLDMTGGSIQDSTAFTSVAEQFGDGLLRNRPLRELNNDRKLTDPDLDRSEPHALSEVLSGALYSVMKRTHEELKAESARGKMDAAKAIVPAEVETWRKDSAEDAAAFYEERARAGDDLERKRRASAGRALWVGAQRFKRTVLRALDYLPPGDVTFADYGRAILASDAASHPDSPEQRDWIRAALIERGIADAKDLEVDVNLDERAIRDLDVEALVESDWLAYEFANRNRPLLAIPEAIPFTVRPRLDVRKTYYYRDGARERREILLKVAWSESEANALGRGLPRERRLRRGTTLAIDFDTRRAAVVATLGPNEQDRLDRDKLLLRLYDGGRLSLGAEALAPDGKPLRGVARADVIEGKLRVRGLARTLHAVEVDHG